MYASHPLFYDQTVGQPFGSGLLSITSQGVARRLFSVDQLWGVASLNGQLYMAAGDGTLRHLNVTHLDTSQLPAMASQTTGGANYFLNEYNDGTVYNINQAVRLIGLAEARKVVTNQTTLNQIDQAIAAIDALLRSRQNPDGGWNYDGTGSSDAIVTALAGTALDYSSPPADDLVVLNAVQFLLNTQAPDGSWVSADKLMSTDFASTSLVMAYLPRVLDRIGGINVDLHLNLPANVTLSNPDLPPTSNLTSADGTSTLSWTLEGVTSSGRTVNFDLNLASLTAGEQRPVATAAYLLSTNSFDSSQVRTDLSIPSVKASDGLTLTSLQTDKSAYSANDTAQLTAQVSNTAPANQSGTVVFTIKASDGSIVATIPATAFNNLPASQTAPVVNSWSVGTTLASTYTVVADLYDAAGTLADEKTASLSIGASASSSGTGTGTGTGTGSGASVSLRTTTDKTTYNTTDTVNIADLVQNLSSNNLIGSASLQLQITSPSGTIVYTHTTALGQLVPGAVDSLSNAYSLNAAAQGQYTVSGKVLDSSGAVLAAASAGFTVQENLTVTVTGTETAKLASLASGDSQTCTDVVKNGGTQSLSALPLRQLVFNVDTGVVDQQTDLTASLAAGASQTYTRVFSTGGWPAGHHACVIEAQINGSWKSLANAVFKLTAPVQSAPSIGEQFTQSGKPKVLVLVDAPVTTTGSGSSGGGCIPYQRIELTGPWHNGGVPADATTTIIVNDDQGRVVDTEHASIQGFHNPADSSAGSYGVNLQIIGFTQSSVQVALVPTSSSGFPAPRYQFVATAYENTYLQQINSGVVFPDCVTQTTNNGTTYQDFLVDAQTTGTPTTDDTDPNGPSGSPNLTPQTSFLTSLLSANGWNATLTNSTTAFADDLHNGDYGIVMLLNERTTLSTELQKELREAVHNGAGLIVAGGGEGVQFPTLASTLGLQYTGTATNATGLTLTDTRFQSGGGSTALAYADKVFTVTPSGAALLASYTGLSNAGQPLTQYAYGSGTALFAGYDPLLEATHASSSSLHASILLDLLNAATPAPATSLLADTVLPVTAKLTNQAGAATGQILYVLPGSVTLADPGSGSNFDSSGNLVWPFSLPSGGTLSDTLWLRLPSTAVTLSAQVSGTLNGGSYMPVTSASLSLSASAPHTVSDLTGWMAGKTAYASAYQYLQAAQTDLSNSDVTDALIQMTAASDALIAMNPSTYPDAAWLRQWLDQALYEAERQAPSGAEVNAPSAPNAPTGFTATATSTSQINLSWSASTSSATGAVSYSVYKSTTAGFTPSSSTLIASGLTTTTLSVTGLSAGTTYTFVVQTLGATGTSTNATASAATQSPPSSVACHVTYTVNSDWGSGFGAGITVGNTGTTSLTSWTLSWTWAGNQQITGYWNGNATQSGKNVSFANASWNGSLPAGGSQSGIGFNGSYSGSNVAPTVFYLNGTQCH